MNETILNRIRGKRVSQFSLVRFGHLNYNVHVILHLESGPVFEIKCREFKFGRYEADTLDVSEYRKKPETEANKDGWSVDTIKAGWIVDTIETIERQDWLQPSSGEFETVGNNPTTHAWGPIGTAPKEASHTTIVTSSIVFASNSRHQAMISLVDYPGLLSFTTRPQEIASMHKSDGANGFYKTSR
jgi:hypothetical protein